jgi:hypothetical protein
MTLDELKRYLDAEAKSGTLMTAKHDPKSLGTIYAKYRTVLSHEVAEDLEEFIISGEFTVKEYENLKFPASSLYFVIQPTGNTTYSIPASGVPANSPFATSAVDRLVAVSGSNQGWHLFGESNSVIQQKLSAGDLKFKGDL